MKTHIADTSLKAYEELQDILSKKEDEVLQPFLSGHSYTAYEISNMINMPVYAVAGRINALRYKYGLLIKVGTINKRSIYRKRKPEEEPDKEYPILQDEIKRLITKYRHRKPVPGILLLDELEQLIKRYKS